MIFSLCLGRVDACLLQRHCKDIGLHFKDEEHQEPVPGGRDRPRTGQSPDRCLRKLTSQTYLY